GLNNHAPSFPPIRGRIPRIVNATKLTNARPSNKSSSNGTARCNTPASTSKCTNTTRNQSAYNNGSPRTPSIRSRAARLGSAVSVASTPTLMILPPESVGINGDVIRPKQAEKQVHSRVENIPLPQPPVVYKK